MERRNVKSKKWLKRSGQREGGRRGKGGGKEKASVGGGGNGNEEARASGTDIRM